MGIIWCSSAVFVRRILGLIFVFINGEVDAEDGGDGMPLVAAGPSVDELDTT
jgi:hypothetical protein